MSSSQKIGDLLVVNGKGRYHTLVTSILISVVSLLLSVTVAWLTLLRRGNLGMTPADAGWREIEVSEGWGD